MSFQTLFLRKISNILASLRPISRLQKIQKRALRTLFCNVKFQHSEPIMKKLGLLKIDDLYHMKCLTTISQTIKYKAPTVMKQIFVQENPDSRRWYNIKLKGKLSPIEHDLPITHMIKNWNLHMENLDSRKLLFDQPLSYKSTCKNIQKILISKYYSECSYKSCYICKNST